VSLGEWHLRLHRIETGRPLKAVEGGFALRRYRDFEEAPPLPEIPPASTCALAAFPWGASRIAALEEGTKRTGALSAIAPNLNILYPQALVPVLKGRLEPGIRLWISAVRAGDREVVCAAPLPRVDAARYINMLENKEK
jgi:hypothetical protein